MVCTSRSSRFSINVSSLGENLNPHHHLVDQFRFIGYETAQAVMITKTDAQCLCNIYSGLFGSINKHIGTARTIKNSTLRRRSSQQCGTCHHGKTDDIGHEQHRYGSHIYVCEVFTTILAISSNTYDTVSATKMRMISTNDEKRRTLEYVRNALKKISGLRLLYIQSLRLWTTTPKKDSENHIAVHKPANWIQQ